MRYLVTRIDIYNRRGEVREEIASFVTLHYALLLAQTLPPARVTDQLTGQVLWG